LAQFEDAAVSDPAVAALRGRVKSALDPALPIGAATVAVRTTDGRSLQTTVPHAKGSMEHPLSDEEIGEKVRDLARYGSFGGDVGAIIASVWGIDALTTIGPLSLPLATGGAA
jgi:2-methylcitrate dehydratase PrpD